MRRLAIFSLLWFVATTPSVFGETNEVVLDDGSVIHADVVSLESGKYTMRSASMGTFTIDASRVRRISSPTDTHVSSPVGAPADTLKARVEDAQAAIISDPESMKIVTALAEDPAFKDFLADPEAVAALRSGNTELLKNNPKFTVLMENPKMQDLAARLLQKSK